MFRFSMLKKTINGDGMTDRIVQVPLIGRLGNQLFIYAAARAISLNQKRKLFFSDYDYTLWHNENRLNCFRLSVDVSYQKRLNLTTKQKIGDFIYKLFCRHKDVNQITEMEMKNQWIFHFFDLFMCQDGYIPPKDFSSKNLFMFGYFQCDKFFKQYEEVIRKELEFKTEIFSEDARMLGNEIFTDPKSICIHIRRGDYLNNPVFNVCNTEYYYRAINKMQMLVPEANYYVFSDNIEEVKELFSKYPDLHFSYIDEKYTDQESLYLGTCCKHFIMTNSSYSWWMQFLSKNLDKRVIAPSRWFGVERPCNIYQDNWILIEV